MPSVRMTNELRSIILNRAMEAFNAAKPRPAPSTEMTNHFREGILQSEPYKYLKALFETQTSYSKFQSLDGIPDSVKRLTVSELHLNTENHSHIVFSFVPQLTIYSSTSWGPSVMFFQELPNFTKEALRNPVQNLIAELAQHAGDYSDYHNKIQRLLEECTTVKQMLTAWPAGEAFVPREYISKMYEKVTRIERAERLKREVAFDDSFVNEVVLTAKLVGG